MKNLPYNIVLKLQQKYGEIWWLNVNSHKSSDVKLFFALFVQSGHMQFELLLFDILGKYHFISQ